MGFAEEDHKDKCHLYHIISRVHIINVIFSVHVDLAYFVSMLNVLLHNIWNTQGMYYVYLYIHMCEW